MLSSILAIFARISKPLWLNIRSTGAEVTGRQKTSSNKCQDRDRDSRVPRPRPRPRLWGSTSKTKTETKTCGNGSRDVSRPRLKCRELKSAPYGRNDLLHFKYTYVYVRFDSNFLLGNKYFVTSTSTSTSTEGSSTSTSTSTKHASTSTSTSTRKMYLRTT